jgi:parallel beta-helix repeat protein
MIDHWRHDFVNVSVNGRDIGYFDSLQDINIDNDIFGQFFLLNCENITIQNATMNGVANPISVIESTSCKILDTQVQDYDGTGIMILDSNSCGVINSNFIGEGNHGVLNDRSTNIFVENCTFAGMQYGVISWGSNNTATTNCSFDNGYCGTASFGSNYSNITRNSFNICQIGIEYNRGAHLRFSNNRIDDSETAISMEDISDCVLSHNTLSGNIYGLGVNIGNHLDLYNNTILDTYQTPLRMYDCSDVIVDTQTVVVSDEMVYFDSIRDGIIINSYFDDTLGVTLERCNSVDFENTVIKNSNSVGLELWNSDDITVDGCEIVSNGVAGIDSSGSTSCSFLQNSISGNYGEGISVSGSSNFRIFDCSIINNTGTGIHFSDAVISIISRNSISNNGHHGVYLDRSSYNNLTSNLLINNTDYGLYIWDGIGNIILGNTFAWNQEGNARDSGYSNQWDDGIAFGNIWSDYEGGAYYEISGTAGAQDNFPSRFVPVDIFDPLGSPVWYTLTAVITIVGVIGIGSLYSRRKNKMTHTPESHSEETEDERNTTKGESN